MSHYTVEWSWDAAELKVRESIEFVASLRVLTALPPGSRMAWQFCPTSLDCDVPHVRYRTHVNNKPVNVFTVPDMTGRRVFLAVGAYSLVRPGPVGSPVHIVPHTQVRLAGDVRVREELRDLYREVVEQVQGHGVADTRQVFAAVKKSAKERTVSRSKKEV